MPTTFRMPPQMAGGSTIRSQPEPQVDARIDAQGAALQRAFARAEANKVEILKRPDMLSGEDLAKQLGVARATVDNRRTAGKLLAVEFGSKRGVRYPAWQCELVMDRRADFEQVLQALAPAGNWSRYRFFTQPSAALADATPVQALQRGEGEAVVEAARSWLAGEQGGG